LQTHIKFWSGLFLLAPFICLLHAVPSTRLPLSVIDAYAAMSLSQSARLRGASMQVEIEASLPQLKKHGRLHALRRISQLGRITYEMLHFEGDSAVKSEVIARYLAADVQAQTDDDPSLAVTPANYKFQYKGLATDGGRQVYLFHLTPKKKRVGTFKGDLWLDAETCLPVREAGRLAKNPSFFVKRIDFVREYDIQDGLAIPRQIQSTAETRLVGKAELTVRFHDVALAGSPSLSTVAGSGQ
jgi:hypothetical protein